MGSGIEPGDRRENTTTVRWRPREIAALARWAPVFLVLVSLAGNAWGDPRGKVELCHLPPDNPENTQTLMIDARDVDAHLAHGDVLGACPPTAAVLDPPTVRIDPDLVPPAESIAGINGGPPRPLARLHSPVGDGYDFDFVANEVYLITDDPAELAAFRSRWPTELLLSTALPPTAPGGATTSIHLLSVDASGANPNRLDRDLALLSRTLHGAHFVSGEAGMRLLALVAGEIRREGLKLGINALLRSQDLGERVSEEAMEGDPVPDEGPPVFEYSSNAFDWPYLERNPRVPGTSNWPSDTGAADAVRVVEAAGRLGNRVKTLIADAGFYPNADFPDYTVPGTPVRTPNPDPTGCGSDSPAVPGTPCGTHGTQVVMAGFARPDNQFGGFGPGGAVSELILLQSPSIDIGSLGYYIVQAVPAAITARPRIINVSASTSVAAGWCFIVCEPLDLVGEWLNENGILFVAAAGNQRRDVDALDEFCVFEACVEFEEAAVIPCELDHVMCVGAHSFLNSGRAFYSNYGSIDDGGSVDIYAPGNIYSVNAIMADSTVGFSDALELAEGTSYAAPFLAGVAALTWAANPSLSLAQLRACLLGTAHPAASTLTGEPRRVNALGAASCALGGSHPWVGVSQPADGLSIERGVTALVLVADSDDYEDVRDLGAAPTIHWTSSLDGSLGTTSDGGLRLVDSTGLTLGTHDICARVTDRSSRSWTDCAELLVTSARPTLDLILPETGAEYYEGQPIDLVALVSDPDGPPPTVEWRSSFYQGRGWDEMSTIATGASARIPMPGWMVSGRSYTIAVRATDETGAFSASSVGIRITSTPENLPPTVSIEAPLQGASFESADGGPVTIELVASATDPEDGPIDFEEIDWRVSVEDGFFQDLEVSRDCLVFEPGGGSGCVLYGPWTFQLSPRASQTTTRFRIRGWVWDRDGRSGYTTVTVFVTQLII